MEKILFHPELAEREHGSNLLYVPDLLAWLKSKQLHLRTEPPFAEFEFAQVEALLSAVERPFHSLTDEQALALVTNDDRVKADERLTSAPGWVLASNAHSAWRETLDAAISAGELVLLDFASKMPVSPKGVTPPAPDANGTKKQVEQGETLQVPITVLTPPPPQSGDYIETLEQWGALPEVLPLPDAAGFIGHRCNQNPAAILKVLEQAVLRFEIPFSGLTSAGVWEPGFIRFFHRFKDKPVVTNEGGGAAQVAFALEHGGRLHSEAMGVSIADAVALLAKRGRKLPDELRHLLPEQPAPEAVDIAPVVGDETPKERRARLLQWREAEEAIDKRGAHARTVKREQKNNPSADSSNISKDIKKARDERNAAQRQGKIIATVAPTANNPFGITRVVEGKKQN